MRLARHLEPRAFCMDDQFHVFISYNQTDGELAATVATVLSDLGLKPFLAEKELGLGVSWENSLKHAIRNSSVILFLITQNSKLSGWVHAEAGAAWILEKPIVPLFFRVEPSELIEILRLRQGRNVDISQNLKPLLEEVATLVSTVSKPLAIENQMSTFSKESVESFTNINIWDNLLKIGTWSHDEATNVITGRGIHNYLLSAHEYRPNFAIQARIIFEDLHGVNSLDAVNAGIVCGWTISRNVRRYFNVLFNESKIWLELIGDRGGDAYLDYKHLDSGIEFKMVSGQTYEVNLSVAVDHLILLVKDSALREWKYTALIPEAAVGRVGFRPWRSRVKCQLFRVQQL